MTTPTSTHRDLPAPIRDFLAAHAVRDVGAAARAFAPDAVVVDDGRTYRGTDEVLTFLSDAGSEFTYTTTLVSVRRTEDGWAAGHRLDGDFPGGVVDLEYRFTMAGDLIAALVIAP